MSESELREFYKLLDAEDINKIGWMAGRLENRGNVEVADLLRKAVDLYWELQSNGI